MDILTPAGQETIQHELMAIARLSKAIPSLRYVHTPKHMPVRVDALLMQGDSIYAVVECKCRKDVTLEEFRSRYGNSWLVTFDKLVAARKLAMQLGVPLVGLVYFVQSDRLLAVRLCEADGEWLCSMRIARTQTQATVNGGSIVRANAYVSMDSATEI